VRPRCDWLTIKKQKLVEPDDNDPTTAAFFPCSNRQLDASDTVFGKPNRPLLERVSASLLPSEIVTSATIRTERTMAHK